MKFCSHVARVKYYKKDSRYPPFCTKWGPTSGNNFKKPSEEGEARDPSPDSEVREDFLSIMGVYIFRDHVAPRTKLFVTKDDYPTPLDYIHVQRQTNTSPDALQEATIDDYWNMDVEKSVSEPWIGVTRFMVLNKNPPEGYTRVQG